MILIIISIIRVCYLFYFEFFLILLFLGFFKIEHRRIFSVSPNDTQNYEPIKPKLLETDVPKHGIYMYITCLLFL